MHLFWYIIKPKAGDALKKKCKFTGDRIYVIVNDGERRRSPS
ncbi:hypothetical protein [Nostoc sp. UIC 10630]|nr:hypothetical protein [Nostoc sp. UIC 10630]